VAEAWADCGEVTSDDRYLVVNPFFHSFGYKAGLVVALLTGATVVPQAVFDVSETFRVIDQERITVLPGAPAIYQAMLESAERDKHDLSSLRLAVTGAATVPVALVERMQSEMGFDSVLTAYGLTEAVVATMCRLGDTDSRVANTCGRAAGRPKMSTVNCIAASLCDPPPDTRNSVMATPLRFSQRSFPSRSAKANPSRIAL
jgi:acyl-CoA synthetase (AMP-forming)/AMP-acid ligase II